MYCQYSTEYCITIMMTMSHGCSTTESNEYVRNRFSTATMCGTNRRYSWQTSEYPIAAKTVMQCLPLAFGCTVKRLQPKSDLACAMMLGYHLP